MVFFLFGSDHITCALPSELVCAFHSQIFRRPVSDIGSAITDVCCCYVTAAEKLIAFNTVSAVVMVTRNACLRFRVFVLKLSTLQYFQAMIIPAYDEVGSLSYSQFMTTFSLLYTVITVQLKQHR
jgi:hypothetical protein